MRAASAVNERTQLGGRERTVHVAPTRGGLRVDVVASERDLERAGPAHESMQALRAAPAGDDAECDLGLPEHRSADRGEAHVERQRELAAAAPGDAFEHRDGGLRHGAEPIDHRVKDAELGVQRGVVGGQRLDERDVGVGGEEVGVGGIDDDDSNRWVGFDLATEAVELDDQRRGRGG